MKKPRLTPAQKRELEILKRCDGYRHIYGLRLTNIFWELWRKGFVRMESGFGQLQSGSHVYLVERFESLIASTEEKFCKWQYDEFHDNWETSCGSAHIFIVDGPRQNGYTHCPYCGGKLEGLEK